MRTLPQRIYLTMALAFVSTPFLMAEDEPESQSDSKPKVTKIDGVLEATSSVEIVADTEHLESLVIKRILPHGKRVSEGENLVWFDREDIDKKIKDAEVALRLSKLTLQGDEFDLEQFRKAQALDKEAAERKREAAQQDFDNFVDIDRDREAKSAAFNLKSSRASLENAQEELHQLEQMYKEDDLTEESEEIVLKRAKQAVESAQFRLESTEIQANRVVEQGIPRSTASQEDALERAEMAYQKSMNELNLARQRREIEMGQKRDKLREDEEKLAELKAARKQMVLVSPIDGIALHGKLTRGRIGDKPSGLEADTKVSDKQVLLTVVDPAKLRILVDLEEAHLGIVTPGATCKVKLKAFPEFEASGTVKSVSTVPYAGNKYDCIVALHAGKLSAKLLPTRICELQFQQANELEPEKDDDASSSETQAKDEKAENDEDEDGACDHRFTRGEGGEAAGAFEQPAAGHGSGNAGDGGDDEQAEEEVEQGRLAERVDRCDDAAAGQQRAEVFANGLRREGF